MEVWSGDVSLGDGAGKIQGRVQWVGTPRLGRTDNYADVHLEYAQPTSRLRLSSSAELRFLSLVDATGIPLHLAAGPSLGVWTTSEHTEAWFYDNIIGDDIAGRVSTDGAGPHRDPWWCRGGGQSDWGILLGVDQGTVSDGQVGPKITEILLYASMEVDQVGNMALPTPPASSSPSPDAAGHDALSESARRQARIYALPLSSELLHRYDISQASQSLPTESANDGHGQFLQLPVDDHNPPSGASQKRSRISSLFEDATQRQKKVKRKGGVSISEVMASLERPPSSHGHGLSTLKRGLEEDAVDLVNENPQQTQTQRVGLSRSASAASLGARRPSSRRVITDRKAALLRRIASVATLDNISLMPAGEISIEQQNKNALSRLVMAGMRIYGLQQRKKASRSRAVSEAASSTGITQGPAQTQESDDEYKLVYHQAFKAASFTFRKSIATRIVSQEAMRDVVDRLLALFCTDPSDKNEINDGFGGDWEEGRGNFDPPSGRAVTRAGDGGWSTPTTRKRHRDGSHQAMVE
ncbi:MAG: hypothetical protein LQ347_004412, partial [Umbilicaria vellea]